MLKKMLLRGLSRPVIIPVLAVGVWGVYEKFNKMTEEEKIAQEPVTFCWMDIF